jgi:uncharacterized protein
MSGVYHDGNRHLQDRFDTRRLADRLEERIVHDFLDEGDKAFIGRMEMFFLATADEFGFPNCSYKGGDRGFVRVVDDRTIAFPNYDGNGMYLSMGNVLRNPNVGLLFVDWENQWRLRYNGVASIAEDDPLMAAYPEAQFIVRVRARQVFPACPRYIHKMAVIERSAYVPHRERATPVPDWKREEWVADVLPEHDPARFVDDDTKS